MRLLLALAALAAPFFVAAPATAGVPAADDRDSYVSSRPGRDRFPLVGAPLVVSAGDHAGVIRVVDDLQADIAAVTGVKPAVGLDKVPGGRRDPVLVGTIGKSPLIDRLVAAGKLDVRGVAGKWETSLQQIVENPLPGVRRAFVIAGSDQRGSIYGVYDLSRRIGVSPWRFFDDVPVAHRDAVYLLPGRHTQGTPAVKYRGFFINDENPATGTWAPGYFGPGKAPGYPGGLNAAYYAKVFETMLRLKANYLWPAVWGRAFAEDDPQNHATASFYGVVMGTSHEAPMMRGIEEWNRHPAGTREWSFRRNPDAIKAYWRDGAERMAREKIEGVVTLGMRGNGDVSLPDGDGIDLMSSIIDTQRQILRDTGLIGAPQVQTLYKEVQRYWDRGYRPPEDVTVVFCDDNWGNMRKLPDASLPARSGGYGLYYHFDYVGGGRNYKWADTVNLTNTWEQLNLAYRSGVDRLWMVNVGDLKNEEQPTQLFLDYAWKPFPLGGLGEWERGYAAQNFGPALAGEIAGVLGDYGHLQSRRKPELLNRRITIDPATKVITYDDEASPFSLTDYREIDRVTAEWQALAARAEKIKAKVPAAWQDAYFQLVWYQVKATANLYALRLAEFTNIRYAGQGRAATNRLADLAEARFADDQALNAYYNTGLAGGKWKNWQLQPKIGYGNVARYGPNAPWQQPEKDNVALPDEIYPYLKRIEVPAQAELGVDLDGGDPETLPAFSPYQAQPQQFIEVYNKGTTPFPYTITSAVPWVQVTPAAGTVTEQVRATVRVDWRRAPKGTTTVPLTVTGAGASRVVRAPIDNPVLRPEGFVEANGYVAMEADHYTRKVGDWRLLPEIGKTGNGLTPLGGEGARLEYAMTLTTTGPVQVTAVLSPRNNTRPTDGLKYAISLDDQPPQTVNITTATGADDTTMNKQWERNTSDNVNRTTTTHTVAAAGTHTLKFWMVDPTVIVQRLEVDTGGVPYSYLGPPESRQVNR
ncbi:glycosyl hydrolase 115 family protein [Actinoplanes sp. NPDC049599]|uniref:glycosyl hydrolase 115 family protein n=1 Tax=Actinoplanes sp. NPDC049599 TaxID=3363903 RepID=UPI0037A66367